jgi:hypothetical protein
MSQFDWPITPKKLKLWKLPKREGSILKHRIQWTLHSPHNAQLEKQKNTSQHPQETKRDSTSLHSRLLIGCMEIQFLKVDATIFGLKSPPSHVQLFHKTFLWHGSTT